MELPQQLIDAIGSALNSRILDIEVDNSFVSDGFAGSEVERFNVTYIDHETESTTKIVIKRWNPTPWFAETGHLSAWLEIIFEEHGVFDVINTIPGLFVPVIGSCGVENHEWIIMEDVSAELDAWKSETSGPGKVFWQTTPDCVGLYADLLDRLAQLHVMWETPDRKNELQGFLQLLTPKKSSGRAFEEVFREWFGSDGTESRPPVEADLASPGDQWASKAKFAAARRKNNEAFLGRLSEKDRQIWLHHMLYRDDLVKAASALPYTLLHGDLSWRNIGLRRSAAQNELILIDWEGSSFGSHAFEVMSLIAGKAFSADELLSLEGHYFDRYKHYGGKLLDRLGWNRACEVALANNGICRLPHNSEIIRRQSPDTYAARTQALIDRTARVLHDLGP